MNTNLATFLHDGNSLIPGKHFPFTEHYRQIGMLFSTLEASTLRVGVLVPFPTAKIRSLFRPIKETVNDYLKVNLVNISTEVLESYLDDLKQLRLDEQSNTLLHLTNLSDWEKHGVLGILLLILIVIFLFGHNLAIGLFGVGASAVILAALCLSKFGPGSEQYRRNTFIYYLTREIMRRKGIAKDQPFSTVRVD